MKENKYDERFFGQYSLMSRSVQELRGAGEWHELKKMMLPDFNGKRVLDLGCSFGWHCRDVTKYHKTLTTYVNGLIKAGFRITHLVESQPDESMLDTIPGMRDELRRPMMLLIAARKI